MSEKDIDRVLSHPFKATHEAVGLTKMLPLIWRTILYNYNVGLPEYSKLVTEYLHDARNRVSPNPNKRNSLRNNMAGQLFDIEQPMSIKSLFRGFNVMRFTRLEIRIITWREDDNGYEEEDGVEHEMKIRVRKPRREKNPSEHQDPQ